MPIRIDLIGWALLLIAIATAYIVCLKASKEESRLFKYGGYAVGIFILVVSLILAISNLVSHAGRGRVPALRRAGALTRPTIAPGTKAPDAGTLKPERTEAPTLPRRTIGIVEPEQTAPKTGE